MKPIFQKNLQFSEKLEIFDLEIVKKFAQMDVFGHFLDFASLIFLDFAHNDRWAWWLVVFLQFAGPVNVFWLMKISIKLIIHFLTVLCDIDCSGALSTQLQTKRELIVHLSGHNLVFNKICITSDGLCTLSISYAELK